MDAWEIFASTYRLEKKICFEIPRIFDLFYLHFYKKNIVKVTMRIEEAFYNISMYLYIVKMSYNKNMLKLLEVDLNRWFVILKVALLFTDLGHSNTVCSHMQISVSILWYCVLDNGPLLSQKEYKVQYPILGSPLVPSTYYSS